MLDQFHASAADVPVLICGVDTVLRNPSDAQIAECLGFNDVTDARCPVELRPDGGNEHESLILASGARR